MVPVVVLVGRQNVGKSTLFNYLTRTRDALVSDFSGLTRDRKYGLIKVRDREFICVDTGGIDSKKKGVEVCVLNQSFLAVKESDIVLFMVDARDGLMPDDFVVMEYLRPYKKKTFIVVNKVDGMDINQATADFWSLGFSKIYPVSSSHGYGVTNLLENVLLPFVKKITFSEKAGVDNGYLAQFKGNKAYKEKEVNDFNVQRLSIKLAIVGRPNSGKSTLTNRLLDEDRVVTSHTPGTTRDSIYTTMQHGKYEYVLIDTAGVRKRGKVTDVIEKISVVKSLQAIKDADVVLLVIDARIGVSDQDLSLLRFIVKNGRSVIISVNKWDNLSQKIKKQIKETLYRRLKFIDFIRIHFISALHGNGVNDLFDSINEAYGSATQQVRSATLTRIMNTAVKNHHPPFIFGRSAKLKYAHVGGYNPLVVVIHGNQVKDLSDSYKRYLINYFRKSLCMIGTPIRLQFKEGDNPYKENNSYKNKHNVLMPIRKKYKFTP